MSQCPCGSGSDFDECCGPIMGGAPASTPEALMRSRFAAFVHGDLDYIESTHAKEVRDDFNRSAAESTAKSVEWVSLEIRDTADGGADDDTGTVEFAAISRTTASCRFITNGRISAAKRGAGSTSMAR